jgi:hypothetical protein
MEMTPKQAANLIECLEKLGERPGLFLGKIDIDAAELFLSGFMGAVRIALLDDEKYLARWEQVVQNRGWEKPKATGSFAQQMIQKGMSPSEVIQELVAIEVESLRRAID